MEDKIIENSNFKEAQKINKIKKIEEPEVIKNINPEKVKKLTSIKDDPRNYEQSIELTSGLFKDGFDRF